MLSGLFGFSYFSFCYLKDRGIFIGNSLSDCFTHYKTKHLAQIALGSQQELHLSFSKKQI
jgi:hypothetical protein